MRVFTVGGERSSFDTDELLRHAVPYRFRLCHGGRRVAVWLRDVGHDHRRLLFADADTGDVVDRLDDVAPGYGGGDIELCRDGGRVVHLGADDGTWHFRDLTPGGWADHGPFDSGLAPPDEGDDDGYDDLLDDAFDDGASFDFRLAASADGRQVVMVATRADGLGPAAEVRPARAAAWVVGDGGHPARRAAADRLDVPPHPVLAVAGGDRPRAAVAADGRVAVWDLVTGHRVADLAAPGWAVTADGRQGSLLFSAAGRRLVAFAGGRLSAWDAADWAAVAVDVPAAAVRAVAVSADGRRLAAADDAGVVRLWDAATGAAGVALAPPARADDWDTPAGLAFSADGSMAMVGYWSGRAAVWDLD